MRIRATHNRCPVGDDSAVVLCYCQWGDPAGVRAGLPRRPLLRETGAVPAGDLINTVAVYDRSSKWLIQHHGDAILRLAGIADVVAWRALHSELVQTGQLPDGLIEAKRRSRPSPHPYIVEIATYPERRLEEQLLRGSLLVLLDRRVVPDIIAVILRPKGRYRVPESVARQSANGWSEVAARWRIVELWKVSAEALLSTGDPGLMPWVPLAEFPGRPEPVLRRCREVIEQTQSRAERPDLLAVTQLLAGLRYNDPGLMSILGGRTAMIESPLLQELTNEARVEATARSIVSVLDTRFGPVPPDLQAAVREIQDLPHLDTLIRAAARCDTLESFRAHLNPG